MPVEPPAAERGLLDTSVFMAQKRGRVLGALPAAAAISVVRVAELHLGVLRADRPAVRTRWVRTLASVQSLFEPLAADSEVARPFAEIVAQARREGRRPEPLPLHTTFPSTRRPMTS